MRQTTMTEEDNKLRLALENMRYGACTEDDLTFLRSRVAGFSPESPKLDSPEIRNVSIISARNSQKDLLNELGARRFARDTNQVLEEVYSVDRLSSRAVNRQKWANCSQSEVKSLNARTRRTLWDSMPSTTTDFIPGKLLLCVGMPVMLRANDATELCITKGQEGVVVGWDSSVGPAGQKVLDTLFVRLVDPPRQVKIDDLPINVVPIPRVVTHVTFLLPNDTLLSILRDQVVVLLNFGMTDFTAQGKSRIKNVVELSYCSDHRSYYVALSRGRSANGTVILQNFDAKKITSGMHGYLRQELRELEALDEITRLRYLGRIPASVTGIYRRRLLRSYYAWKTDHRDPDHFHPAIRWKPELGPRVPEAVAYSDWTPSVAVNQKIKLETAKGPETGKDEQRLKKIKVLATSTDEVKLPVTASSSAERGPSPVGLKWDDVNYSCAYDALFTLLINVWTSDPERWHAEFATTSASMSILSNGIKAVISGSQSLERTRNQVRRYLHTNAPDDFPYGPNSTSVDKLGNAMFPSISHGTGKQVCANCGFRDPTSYAVLESFLSAGWSRRRERITGVPISEWMTEYFSKSRRACPDCPRNNRRSRMVMTTVLNSVPNLMLISIDSRNLTFDKFLNLNVHGQAARLALRGIVYGGLGHFTCRYVSLDGWIWFHDGITAGRRCVREFQYDSLLNKLDLQFCRERHAVAVLYALE
ncbi:hypothetical protein B0H13DRAFT_1642583 [Mycena leptocephala]|nr:hypothetical protein B0H13DRAFT_1642583 [Mycena leptocephala]